MSHRVTHELVYPDATAEQVLTMLLTPAFREAAVDAQRHIVGREVAVDGRTVTVDQRQSTERVPGFARKFVGDEIRIVQTETWSAEGRADIAVTVPGKPGHASGTAEVAQRGSDVVQTVMLDVTVDIPFLGGKLAAMIGDKLVRTLDSENQVGRTWLTESSGEA
jgi:hypothetical protein